MNFLASCPGRPVVSRMNVTRLMCGYLSNLLFSALLATCPGRVLAAATRDGLQEKGAAMETSRLRDGTVEVEEKVHACMLPLSVHAGESWHLLFNEHLDATV